MTKEYVRLKDVLRTLSTRLIDGDLGRIRLNAMDNPKLLDNVADNRVLYLTKQNWSIFLIGQRY